MSRITLALLILIAHEAFGFTEWNDLRLGINF